MFPSRAFWFAVWCILLARTPGTANAKGPGLPPGFEPPKSYVVFVTGLPTPSHWHHAAVEAVSRRLKDPWSAHYLWKPPQGILLCGLVNAKNSYGGYNGWEPFYVIDFKDEASVFLYSWKNISEYRYAFAHPFSSETRIEWWNLEVSIALLSKCGFVNQ